MAALTIEIETRYHRPHATRQNPSESDSSAGGKRAAMPADETAVVSLREEDADYQGQTAALPGAQPTSPDLDGSDLQHGLGVLRDGVSAP